ncbi:hypothetical protein L2755_08420 [Shewanella abyssi]|uniref:hypothetical protein n=1 Tax=Shewanella abyssi TaxID=311789 RepID=UPI00200CE985|nr:hypothetical protein [Shewanella abyssi]MCL1049641.1 hypothetical protein [Shewanella abyssi]
MSKSLVGSFVLASGLLISLPASAQTCFTEGATGNGPTLPATCVNVTIEDQHNEQVTLAVSAIRQGEDITNFFEWTSDLDGYIGRSSTITASLSAGEHTIRAYSTMPHLRSYYDEITVSVGQQVNNCVTEAPSTVETYDEWYTLDFTNATTADINVSWLRYEDGERIHYKTIKENGSASFTGYPGNNWIVTDSNDQCLSVHTTGYNNDTILISK